MQFKSVLLASVLAALAQAVEFTNPTFATVTAGKPFEISWTGASGPVTILLKNGDPLKLETVSTISSGLTGNTFTWNVPASITQDTYALEIRDSTAVPNYSTQFEVIGGVRASASGTVSRTATGTESSTGSATGSVTQTTGTSSVTQTGSTTGSATGTASTTSTRSITTSTSTRPSSTPTTSTTAPPGGMASGVTSNLALVFLAFAALFMIN